MNASKMTATLAAIGLTGTPLLCAAAGRSSAAAEACAQAFVTTLATADKPAPVLKATRYLAGATESGVPTVLTLTAVNPHTNVTVARATCRLGTRGEVLAIEAEPLARL